MRTDLFFGAGTVDAASWSRFVAQIVTPRFPQGLTILDAGGQWRDGAMIHREPTRLLVIYHRDDVASGARVETIRSIYRRRFSQQSVLRADSTACIAF